MSLASLIPELAARCSLIHQRITDAKVPLGPEVAQKRAFLHEIANTLDVRGQGYFCIAFIVAIQYPHLLGQYRVQKEGRMCRYQQLTALRGMAACFR